MSRIVAISDLMESSGVKFGTSGARGLVTAMTDEVCYAYTTAFLQHIEECGDSRAKGRVAVAVDRRPSSPAIARAVLRAIADRNYEPCYCGEVPSPAVALYGLREKIPSIMVTGSHIPDDRNGIKFNKVSGEILKDDELGIRRQSVILPRIFDQGGALLQRDGTHYDVQSAAAELYTARWLNCFDKALLEGKRIGLYGHSAVGRDLLFDILTGLGASVERLAYSDRFIPVDTEAIRPEDVELAARWASESRYDAIVSTDGDSDRPLIADEKGRWLRGDVAGVLCAQFLDADVVVTPVSCNTVVERCGRFSRVSRTRIGSPFVIEEMLRAVAAGGRRVVGYEANGGFLTASAIKLSKGIWDPLPTRDPVIVILSVLAESVRRGAPVSALCASLPARVTASDRLKNFPAEIGQRKVAELVSGGGARIEAFFGSAFGSVKHIDTTDGLRITFETGCIVHVRPSGNAPELRCYTECDTEAEAVSLAGNVLELLEGWR
jgi:phosphomannomutase